MEIRENGASIKKLEETFTFTHITDSDITMTATSIIKRVAGGGIVENEEMSHDKFNALRSDNVLT